MSVAKRETNYMKHKQKKKSLMFGFVTQTWNPLVMRCRHKCRYCYAQPIIDRLMEMNAKYKRLKAYPDSITLVPSELNRVFKPDDFVFIQSMGDLFLKEVHENDILSILETAAHSDAEFLTLTKNPARMAEFADRISRNCMVGITAETNRSTSRYSKAPVPEDRFREFRRFLWYPFRRLVVVEPVMEFDLKPFSKQILSVKPSLVAVGYDNHNNCLPEPRLSKTLELIQLLELHGVKIHYKTLRQRWKP